jgi:DNA repair and recombination RAD54-like protein
MEEKKAKRELKAKNSAKVKRIWKNSSMALFPENYDQLDESTLSSKFIVIGDMMTELFKRLEEKIIIVSNYTETLTIFEDMCKKRNYPYVRFDGKTNIGQR